VNGADKVVALGLCICKHKAGEEVGAETPKLSHCGLVPGLPCQTAMMGSGW